MEHKGFLVCLIFFIGIRPLLLGQKLKEGRAHGPVLWLAQGQVQGLDAFKVGFVQFFYALGFLVCGIVFRFCDELAPLFITQVTSVLSPFEWHGPAL